MNGLLKWLKKKRHPYEPLIVVNIFKDRLIHNLNEFKKIAPKNSIAPVLKSNAYGHGMIEIGRILDSQKDIPFFIVDSHFEAVALRNAGIRKPLLIIGYTRPETILQSKLYNVVFTVSNIETLRTLEASEQQVYIHLKVDTGMNRQGITEEELEDALHLIGNSDWIHLEGICSHLSDADNPDPSFTQSQINVWNRIVHTVSLEFPITHIHLSATSGHRYSKEIHANMSRLGLGLYGLIPGYTFNPRLSILPVMEMKTIITGIKEIKRDQTLGYDNSFKAEKDLTISTIPVGYFEGIDRRLSNKGFVLVGKEQVPCRILGKVSMNITIIDVTELKDIEIGTEVTVISSNSSDPNSIVNMAKMAETIPYEIAVHIPAHLKRNYIFS